MKHVHFNNIINAKNKILFFLEFKINFYLFETIKKWVAIGQ